MVLCQWESIAGNLVLTTELKTQHCLLTLYGVFNPVINTKLPVKCIFMKLNEQNIKK